MMTCPSCTTRVPDASRFCLACGTSLRGSSAPTLVRADGIGVSTHGAPPPCLSPPGAALIPGAILAGRYRLVDLLGKGGMGEVYRADDLTLGEAVALKLLPADLSGDPELLARFHQEVRIARKISHPNVCRVFDIGELQDRPFLSMEYVDGEDLASLLRRIGHLPAKKAVEIARQLCTGIAAAHEKRVLHRDLKPANVMIDGYGRVRITDFGLAGLEGELAAHEMHSGTPAYMAPEQLAGGQVSIKSDLYALGLIMYEMLTGRRPFKARSPSDLARQQREAVRIPPTSVVPGIDAVTEQAILRCLAYEPVDRPASAREVAAALPSAEALERTCPDCGCPGSPGFLFCGKCGAPFAESTARSVPRQPSSRSAAKELVEARSVTDRRQLTVLFCDLAGSTVLAEKLDPEQLSELLQAYQRTAGEVVERFGGHVAQRLGDGLRAYFGFPRAHEDDARRAVYAGREILAAVERLNLRLGKKHGVRLDVRVAAHTGTVVAGEMVTGRRREPVATGPTLNVAALLLDRARAGTLLVSRSTYSLVRGFFVFEELGAHHLKGLSRPVEVYQVRDEADWGSRFELAVSGDLTPLVGRDLEIALLSRSLDRVRQGRGQTVVITGEPGIGKSRLVFQIRELLAADPIPWWFCRCSPYYQTSAFHPVLQLFRRILRFKHQDSPERRLARLERRLKVLGLESGEAVPLLAPLLALPFGESSGSLLSPQAQKEGTLHLLLDMVLKAAEKEPVIAVVEDLHWIDPSSLELLELLTAHIASSRLLVVMTARPSFNPPWGAYPYLTNMTLDRLSEDEAGVMIDELAGGKSLPEEVRHELLRKADGIPLAIEELTRMVLESDILEENESGFELAGPLAPLAIPATLQDSLEARLDRLGPFREIAQLAATIGRDFSYELLQAVSALEAPALREALDRLVDAGLLLQRGLLPQATYVFKHALIQDAAYRSLLKSDRRRCHGRIAGVLTERFPDTAGAHPEVVAHHYAEAHENRPAVEFWLRAGQLAAERWANLEAIDHLENGLALLDTLPDTAERDRLELGLRVSLGPPLMKTRGFVDPEVEKNYERARELCRREVDTPQLSPVLWGLWQFYLSHAQLATARELGEQLLRLAQRTHNTDTLPLAHSMLGEALFFLGKLPQARTHFEQGLELYDPDRHPTDACRYGHDPGVACLCFGGWTLWPLGHPNQALEQTRKAVELATELDSPFSLAEALITAANLHQLRREAKPAQERAEAALSLSQEKGFGFWLPIGTFLKGWAVAEQGEREEGLRQMREGLSQYKKGAAEHVLPWFLSILAETLVKAGEVDEALSFVTEAMAVVEKTGERWWEAELHRQKGEMLLLREAEDRGEAESCFGRALAIAREQRARSLELRAAVSSYRLSKATNRAPEARRALAEVYGWFTEGLSSEDLLQAKALLET